MEVGGPPRLAGEQFHPDRGRRGAPARNFGQGAGGAQRAGHTTDIYDELQPRQRLPPTSIASATRLQRYVTAERRALVDQLRKSADGVVRRTLDAVPGLVGKVLLYVVLALVVLVGGPFAWGSGWAACASEDAGRGKGARDGVFSRAGLSLRQRISAQAGGARAYCRQSLHLRSACTIFASKGISA